MVTQVEVGTTDINNILLTLSALGSLCTGNGNVISDEEYGGGQWGGKGGEISGEAVSLREVWTSSCPYLQK